MELAELVASFWHSKATNMRLAEFIFEGDVLRLLFYFKLKFDLDKLLIA